MKVDCALLCDAVTVREGLLHVLGGGITRLMKETYPAPLGAGLALRILVHPTEANREHRVEARLQNEDGSEVERVEFTFATTGEASQDNPTQAFGLLPGEELGIAVAVPLQYIKLQKAGGYSLEILIDGQHKKSIPFMASQIASDESQ